MRPAQMSQLTAGLQGPRGMPGKSRQGATGKRGKPGIPGESVHGQTISVWHGGFRAGLEVILRPAELLTRHTAHSKRNILDNTVTW